MAAGLYIFITLPTAVVTLDEGATASTLSPWNMNDPWSTRGYDFDPRPDFKLSIQPKWLQELRQTPRRMKRPLPIDKPGPQSSHRRGAY